MSTRRLVSRHLEKIIEAVKEAGVQDGSPEFVAIESCMKLLETKIERVLSQDEAERQILRCQEQLYARRLSIAESDVGAEIEKLFAAGTKK